MIIFRTLCRFIYKWIDCVFLAGCCPNIHSLKVRRAIRSKKQHRKIFEQHSIPHAKGLAFNNPLKAFQFVKQYGFPVVVKPNVGGFSRGSYFPITNYRELIRGIIGAKRY